MNASHPPDKSFFASPRLWLPTLAVLLLAGLGVRLFDLTDLPLDFHPTRQLLSALKARGIFYQGLTDVEGWKRDFAIREWKTRAQVEPEAFEHVVALTYRVTGERLWVPRLYSSIFWTLAALFLFWLVRDLVSTDAGLNATAVHLFLPYGLAASRSFQPDPLMVLLIVVFWWAIAGWARNTWPGEVGALPTGPVETRARERSRALGGRLAVIAGLAGGLAIYIKLVAAFFVIAGGLGIIVGREPLRELLRRSQLRVILALGALPGGFYVVSGVWFTGHLGQQFGGRFIPELFFEPSYYLGWLSSLGLVIGPAALTLGLLGLLYFQERPVLRFAVALWIGYLMFGLYFNYHISTHDYYSLPLIPIVAISMAPLASFGLSGLSTFTGRRVRVLALLIFAVGLGAVIWERRAILNAANYRPEAMAWAEIGERLGPDARVVALTQDYGMRLAYWGWLEPSAWPTSGDTTYHALRGNRPDFESQFARWTQNREYFLVTDFEELDRQPDLQRRLESFSSIEYRADEYAIFDLRSGPGR